MTLYEVIDMLLSDEAYDVRQDGTIWTRKRPGNHKTLGEWRQITTINGNGYHQVKYRGRMIDSHRIVYRRYHGKLIPGYKVDHIDGEILNNHPSNLQQVTTAGNRRKGVGVKLTIEIAEEIRGLRESGLKLTEIEALTGVGFREVSRICKGERWKREITDGVLGTSTNTKEGRRILE